MFKIETENYFETEFLRLTCFRDNDFELDRHKINVICNGIDFSWLKKVKIASEIVIF